MRVPTGIDVIRMKYNLPRCWNARTVLTWWEVNVLGNDDDFFIRNDNNESIPFKVWKRYLG